MLLPPLSFRVNVCSEGLWEQRGRVTEKGRGKRVKGQAVSLRDCCLYAFPVPLFPLTPSSWRNTCNRHVAPWQNEMSVAGFILDDCGFQGSLE